MRKPKNRIGQTAGRIINILPKQYGIKKSAKSLVISVNKYDPVNRGKQFINDTGERILYGKKRRKR